MIFLFYNALDSIKINKLRDKVSDGRFVLKVQVETCLRIKKFKALFRGQILKTRKSCWKSFQKKLKCIYFIMHFWPWTQQNGSVNRVISSRLHNALQKKHSKYNATWHREVNRNKLWFCCSHMEKIYKILFKRNCDYTLFFCCMLGSVFNFSRTQRAYSLKTNGKNA